MMDMVIEKEAEQQAVVARKEQATKDAAMLFEVRVAARRRCSPADAAIPPPLPPDVREMRRGHEPRTGASPTAAKLSQPIRCTRSLGMRSSQALDINRQGSIDMDEFLNLRKIVDDSVRT